MYIKKAAIRLKSFSYYRALGSNYSIALLLAYRDSLIIRGGVLLGSKNVLKISYLGIFRPLLVID